MYVATHLIFNIGDRQYVGNPLHIGVKQLHLFGHFGRLQGQKKIASSRVIKIIHLIIYWMA